MTRGFVPLDHARALAPIACEFVAERAPDALNHERLRALNGARTACADAMDDDARARAFERFVRVASEAGAVLEAGPSGTSGPRWNTTLELGGTTPRARDSLGLEGERALGMFGLASCHRRACARMLEAAETSDVGLGETAATRAAASARRAAGVFAYLASTALPPLRESLGAERANELTASMSEVMALMSLGDAQGIAARRAGERGAGWNLRARLHVAACDFYRDADSILQNSRSDWNGVDILVLASVLFARCAHEAEAYLCQAEALREADKCGEAIAACARAADPLNTCAKASREFAPWTRYHDDLVARQRALNSRLTKENEVVFFQTVPKPGVPLPEPAVVATAIDYNPGDPAKHSFFFD